MADKIEYSRLLLKRTNIAGVVPTIPPVSATTLNQFTPTDIFVGEMFANVEDDRFWIRTNTGIVELNTSGSTGTTVVPTLTQVLNEGDNTGGFDINVSSGNTIIFSGLNSGSTTQYLGLGAGGRVIIATGTTGGSGTSGTSGSSGSSGRNGSSGSSGTSGSNGSSGTSGISPVGLYLPLSGGTVTGNTFFGITSGVTIDQVNNRLGINTANPSSTIEAFGTKSKINYDNTAGGVFQISGDTMLPRFSVAGAPSVTRPLFSLSMGVRTYDDVTYPGYGKIGDGHLYASNEMNGLNIINRQSSGTTLDDYIRFYAGQDANGTTPDIHIQGSGSTRGFVGLGTINPTEKLHVVGNTRLAGDVFLPNVTSGLSTTFLTIDPDTFEVFYTTGSTGGSGTSGTSGSSGLNGSSGTSGVNGSSGTSGVNGSNGSSGTSGVNGSNGSSGSSGTSGVSGSSGSSGVSGSSGSSGVNGTNGSSGTSGLSGVNGTSGSSGTSGSGSSGTSGTSGGGGGGAVGLHFNYPYVPGQLGMITWGQNYGLVNPDFAEARVLAYPIIPAQDVDYSAFTIDQSGTQSGASARIVLYNDNGTLYPNNMIYSSSTIDLYGGGGCCRIHNVLTSGTLSAGTTYWLGIAVSGVTGGAVTLNAYNPGNLWNISRPSIADGFGVVYRYAVSQTFTNFNSLPSTFQKQSNITFNGSWVVDGYFGGSAGAPAIYVKFA